MNRRIKVVIALVILGALWGAWLVFGPSGPPRPITIGKATTFVTGPLDENGEIDFEAALNDQFGKGVTPDSNAVVLLWQAVGPAPTNERMPAEYFQRLGIEEPPATGDYFQLWDDFVAKRTPPAVGAELHAQLALAGKHPWNDADSPAVAEWLSVNEKPLALIVAATGRPHYFNPLISRDAKGRRGLLYSMPSPMPQISRDLARALCARAMHRLSQDNLDGAWQDLIACHRLGRLTARRGTLLESLVGIALEGMAHSSELRYAASSKLSSENIMKRLGDLRQLPAVPPLADKIDLYDRLLLLDTLSRMRREGLDAIEELAPAPTMESDRARWQRALSRADWDESLREANRWYDRLVAAMKDENRNAGMREVQKIDEEIHRRARDPVELEEFIQERLHGPELIDLMLAALFPAVSGAIVTESMAAQRHLNLECAFALEAFRRDQGAYPKTLAELTPQYLTGEPKDLYSGGPLVYQPRGDGYLLYSTGPNGQDDGGLPIGTNNIADDLSLTMPLEESK